MLMLSEAYVIGLLTDVETNAAHALQELADARARVTRISAELSHLVVRFTESRTQLATFQKQGEQTANSIGEANSRTAALHQEIAAIRKRTEEQKREMDMMDPGDAYNQLRRERARLLVQIEDRELEINKLKSEVETARLLLSSTENTHKDLEAKNHAIRVELDRMQEQLPQPRLYLHVFETLAARAHCRLYLDQEPDAWQKEMREATDIMLELHSELRAGKYRLDRYSEVVGGRATASAEAAYAAVLLNDNALCVKLFDLAVDPTLLFDEVFSVYRLWCLGLYMSKRHHELMALLERHRYAVGLRGGYVQCFLGLIDKDASYVASGLRSIIKAEWQLWQDPKLVRGCGVVNIGATAITKLALDAGLVVPLSGNTVPDVLIAGRSRLSPPKTR